MARIQFGLRTFIILILLSGLFLGVGIRGYLWQQYRGRHDETVVTIRLLSNAFERYHLSNREYPPIDSASWPEANTLEGVKLDVRLVPYWNECVFPNVEPDYSVRDAWGNPIRYRKIDRDHVLIWSCGQSGINEIGKSDKAVAGDNISSCECGTK